MKHKPDLLHAILAIIAIIFFIVAARYRSDVMFLKNENAALKLKLEIANARIKDLKDDYKFLEALLIKHNERITQIEWTLKGNLFYTAEEQGIGGPDGN